MILAAIIALSRGGVVGASGVVAAPAVLAKVSDATIDPNPQYSFAYDVQDALTGDSKSQVESRANGVVRGQYTVADPDGTRRIVDYYADPIHGFNAVVRKAPQAVVAPVVAKAAPVAAPVIAKAAPVIAPAPIAPAPLLSRAVAAPLLARAVAPGYAPLAAPAPLAVAPGYPSLAAPAPFAVAPGYASLAAPAPLAVAPGIARVAAPFVAAPPLARVASPYSVW